MAKNPEHMQFIDSQWWCRMTIRPDLKRFFPKSELREPLGPDRAKAERKLPAAKARFIAQLDEAERKLKGEAPPPAPFIDLPLEDLGALHYATTIKRGERFLNANVVCDPDAIYSQEAYDELKEIAAGARSNEEIVASENTSVAIAISRYVREGYIRVEPGSPEWRAVARRLAAAEAEGMNVTVLKVAGEIFAKPRDETLSKEVALPAPEKATVPKQKVRIWVLFDQYIRELKASGKGEESERRWRSVFRSLEEHLGHDDVTRIAKADIISWKDSLIARLSTKTVGAVHLAAVRAVFAWAVANDLLETSPADGVRVKKASSQLGREKGYTDDEAEALLTRSVYYEPADRTNPSNQESAFGVAAKRWAPILCAFSGARITEVCQLRKQDIRIEDGIPIMRFTPEAGSIKTREYRDVPLHPQIIDLGFLKYVESCADGPLFYIQEPGRSANRSARMAGERVARWLRAEGLAPDRVRPNHAWRHRIKTVARDYGLDSAIIDSIVSHSGAARSVSASYGTFTIKAKAAVIDRLPDYQLRSLERLSSLKALT